MLASVIALIVFSDRQSVINNRFMKTISELSVSRAQTVHKYYKVNFRYVNASYMP